MFWLTYITDNRQVGQHVKNFKPDANVLCPLSYRPSSITDEFLCIKTNFNPIVEKRKERRQRERCHEDSDEAKLQNWNKSVVMRKYSKKT